MTLNTRTLDTSKFHTIDEKKYYIDIDEQRNDINCIFKIVGDEAEPVPYDELEYIIKLLNHKLNNYYTEEKVIQLNAASIADFIKKKIEAGDFNKAANVNEYLKDQKVKESDKKEILEILHDYMQEKFHTYSEKDVAEYLNKYKDILHKRRDKNEVFYSTVEVDSEKVVRFQMALYNKVTRKLNVIEHGSHEYSPTFETEFLNPMAIEFAQDAQIDYSAVTPRGFNEADLEITNTNNASLKFVNIGRAYAREIEKETQETKQLYSEDIRNNQTEQEEYENKTPEEQLNSDLERFSSLSESERNALQQEKGYARTRTLNKPNNNAGKMNRTYIIIALVIALLLLAYATYQIFK